MVGGWDTFQTACQYFSYSPDLLAFPATLGSDA
jgi:hypothetical protein